MHVHPMRSFLLIIGFLLVLSSVMIGCGKKGPLYLPGKADTPAKTDEQAVNPSPLS